jgi:hypothetical protein
LQNWEKVPWSLRVVEENQLGGKTLFLGMPNKRIRRYLIDIKDANGQSVFFTAADWSDEERRAAITQILRLDGVPDVYDFSEPKLKPKHGKE